MFFSRGSKSSKNKIRKHSLEIGHDLSTGKCGTRISAL
jgi:hypothetical protein